MEGRAGHDRDHAERARYAGSYVWVSSLTCIPGGDASATFTVRYADEQDAGVRPGVPELEVCTTNPIDVLDQSGFVFHQPVDALVVRDRDGCSRLRQGQWHLARFDAHRLELHSNAQVPQGFPPIPAIKYGWDLAKYVGGKFLPEDDVECVDYGVQELELRVGRSGRLQVRPGYDETVDQVVTTPSADGTTYLWQTTVSGPEVLSVGR